MALTEKQFYEQAQKCIAHFGEIKGDIREGFGRIEEQLKAGNGTMKLHARTIEMLRTRSEKQESRIIKLECRGIRRLLAWIPGIGKVFGNGGE